MQLSFADANTKNAIVKVALIYGVKCILFEVTTRR